MKTFKVKELPIGLHRALSWNILMVSVGSKSTLKVNLYG